MAHPLASPNGGREDARRRSIYARHVYNSPLNYVDPSGHIACVAHQACRPSKPAQPPRDPCQERGPLCQPPTNPLGQPEEEFDIDITSRVPTPDGILLATRGKSDDVKLKLGQLLLKVLPAGSAVAAWVQRVLCGGDCSDESDRLINGVVQAGLKISPDQVVRITRTATGQTVWLETGNVGSGLQHIVERHGSDFAARGISTSQIPDALMVAINQGTVIGQIKDGLIYQFTYADKVQNVLIVISNNGYIVTAHPVTP